MTAGAADAQPPVADADIDQVDLAGVPTERTRAHGSALDRVVVYVHGGGYICGSASGQRAFLAAVARGADAEVYSVDYRLAPEHQHPAAIDDVVAAYGAALELAGGRPVIVGGDSAGGGLAIGAVLELRNRGIALPSAIFVVSPWADMTLTGAVLHTHADLDLMVRVNDLMIMRESYLGAAGDAANPLASPALGDLGGLPPLLVQVGSEEILLGDAQLLVQAATAAGVDARLEVSDGMFHTWSVIAPHLPESQVALDSLTRFIAGA